MRTLKKSIVAIFITFTFLLPTLMATLSPTPALADESLVSSQTGFKALESVFGGARAKTDVRIIAVNIIIVALGFLAVIFLALLFFAGFKYMTAGGNQDEAGKAMAMIKNAVIGLIIVLTSWIIARYAVDVLSRAVRNVDTDYYR